MGAVLLDTTVLIDLMRGRPEAGRRLRALREAGDIPYVCALSIEETVRGLLPGEEDRARSLFAGLRIAPIEESEGWRAGAWRREVAARGRTLAQADCLIAAAAASVRARVATGNPKDFPMRELVVEHWPAGA